METTTFESSKLDSPPSKRSRTESPTTEISKVPESGTHTNGIGKAAQNILDPIAAHVLERAEDWAAAYKEATPYCHGMIRDFCKDGFLGECLYRVLYRF
jgi:hypothetical protein